MMFDSLARSMSLKTIRNLTCFAKLALLGNNLSVEPKAGIDERTFKYHDTAYLRETAF